jgi:transposase-like protein
VLIGVLNELWDRGVDDILIAWMDSFTGFPDAVKAVYPDTRIQLCIIMGFVLYMVLKV